MNVLSLFDGMSWFPFRKVQLIQKRQEGAGHRREFPFRKVQLILIQAQAQAYLYIKFPFRKVQLIRRRRGKTRYVSIVSIPQGTINTGRVWQTDPG